MKKSPRKCKKVDIHFKSEKSFRKKLTFTDIVFQNLGGRKVMLILIQVGMLLSCPGWACTYINQLITTSNGDSGHYSGGKSKRVLWERTHTVIRYIVLSIGRSKSVVGKSSNQKPVQILLHLQCVTIEFRQGPIYVVNSHFSRPPNR